MIIYGIVSAFLNVLAALILGVSVLLKAPKRRENHLFAWFTAGFGVWSLFYILWLLAVTEAEALGFARMLTGASVFIPVTYFHFVSRLTSRRANWEVRMGYLSAVVVAAFTFTPYLVRDVEPALMFQYWPQPGPVFSFYFTLFLYYTVRAWLILFAGLRSATHWRRKQLLYVCFGTVVGWVGGLTNFLLWFNIPVPPVGNGLSLIYIISVGYAMMRFRLVDINIFVVRGLVYLLIIATIALVFPAIDLVINLYVPERIGDLGSVASYVGAFLVTLALFAFVPRFTRRIDAFLEEKAMGAIAGDRHKLREHIRAISAISNLQEIFHETTLVVSSALRVPRVEIFCRHEHEGDYTLQGASAEDKAFFSRRSLTDQDWVVQKTRPSGKAFVIYEQERTEQNEASLIECGRRGLELVIPIHADDIFYGLLLCGSREDNRLYADLDISLLEALCIQIGLTVRARELERRNNQAEKLISLGTLAAGLAHELRNPLVSIRTFTELIGEQGADPEFRTEFKGIVSRDVERIGSIIDHVAAFANNAEVKLSPVDLAQIIGDVYEIAQAEFKECDVEFLIDSSTPLPRVLGNYNQLVQVFLNLFQNAIHAVTGRPSPRISITFTVRVRPDGRKAVVAAVADNGAGITAALRARIFEPFVTTKDTGERNRRRGMGLGLALVKRIVEAHGGLIDVTSTAGLGTTFFIEIPCPDPADVRFNPEPDARFALP